MPHCIIEYAKELESSVDPKQLLAAVHDGAMATKLFAEKNIKTRCIPYEHHKSGAGDITFLHVTTRILSGRTDAQKSVLSESILTELKKFKLTKINISVQVCDIDQGSYAKAIC